MLKRLAIFAISSALLKFVRGTYIGKASFLPKIVCEHYLLVSSRQEQEIFAFQADSLLHFEQRRIVVGGVGSSCGPSVNYNNS